jgi:peptide/nickel transport system substrate-binding protein
MARLFFVPAVTAALLAAGLASAQEATRSHLVIADQFIPDILDGQQSTGGYPLSHELIAQPLLRFDAASGTFLPDLLESFSFSADGTVMTLTLPAGATFSNGKPLDAAALKASFERYAAISPYKSDYDGMTGIEIVDDRTIKITNTIGFNVMLPTMMTSFGAAWDAATAAVVGAEAFAANPVAGGPFRIDAPWTPGLDLELIRNDAYRSNIPFVENKGAMHLERVTTRFIADAQTRANELEAGSVDIAVGLPASALGYMADNPDYQLFPVVLPGQSGLTFNTARAPFNDKALRAALAMALDRDQLVQALQGAAVAESALINPSMIGFRQEARDYMSSLYPTSPEAARAALAAAGWTDSNGNGTVDKGGTELSVELLLDSGSAIDTGAAPVIQAQLKAIGVDVRLTQLDTSALYDTMKSGNFDLGMSGYIWVDPDILTYRFTDGAPSHFAPPELAAALTAARSVADPAARADAYLAIQKMIMDEVPVVPLLSEKLLIGARSWVKGIKFAGPMQLILNDVTIDEK